MPAGRCARWLNPTTSAPRGGTGGAKTGGNYAAALRATSRAVDRGYSIALWLYPIRREAIEEFSGMNLFAVIDGALHTPAPSDSILAGITRDSVIALAKARGIPVHERIMPLDELLHNIAAGRCTEVFATGTAAAVASIAAIGDPSGGIHGLPATATGDALRAALLAVQTRTAPDPWGWTVDVAPVAELAA